VGSRISITQDSVLQHSKLSPYISCTYTHILRFISWSHVVASVQSFVLVD